MVSFIPYQFKKNEEPEYWKFLIRFLLNPSLSSNGLSAFIPFCFFGDDFSLTGKKIGNFQKSTCSLFREKVIDGEVCYEADLNQFKKNTQFEDSLQRGFGLIIDTNEEYDVKHLLRKYPGQEDKNKTRNIFKPSPTKMFRIMLNTIYI